MPKIKVLSDQEARKIAAGEVVERPANIVKELIENSIDAGAKNISIYLEEAGKKLIRIVDNGCGMDKADAQLCFAHHATSKINSVNDLNVLNTFGFRGEALSSISSVSKVTLITKDANSDNGIKLELEHGNIINNEEVACPVGTDISIKDIFYNVPARQKFLKKTETEYRQILQLFQAFCLCYKDVHFSFYSEGKRVYNCPAAQDLRSRIMQLWDHNFNQNMIDINDVNDDTILYGAISNHQFSRYDRNQIFLFVNNRWIKNQNISRAVLKGYLNVLPHGKYPAAFIFIELPKNQVDINVHPRKEEVQFLHPRRLENLIYNTIKKGLEGNLSKQLQKDVKINNNFEIKPAFAADNSFEDQAFMHRAFSDKEKKGFIGASATTFDFDMAAPVFNEEDDLIEIRSEFTEEQKIEEARKLFDFNKKPENHTQQVHKSTYNESSTQNVVEKEKNDNLLASFVSQQPVRNYRLIGSFDKTYILLEKEEGLFVVDQHAAHERVLYEMFSKRFDQVATIKLLFPNMLTLSEQDIEVLIPHLNILHEHGIDAERFSKDQLIIQSTPVYLKNVSLQEIIEQVVAWIYDYQDLDRDTFFKSINEKLHAQMACKAAVKAGDELSQEQIYKLLDDLESVENRFTCPHGRPTSWLLTTYELEKKFKRKV